MCPMEIEMIKFAVVVAAGFAAAAAWFSLPDLLFVSFGLFGAIFIGFGSSKLR